MSNQSKNSLLILLILFTAIFGVLIFTEDTGDMLTGSAAGDFVDDDEINDSMSLKTKVIYVLGIIVFLLLVTYLILLHKYRHASS